MFKSPFKPLFYSSCSPMQPTLRHFSYIYSWIQCLQEYFPHNKSLHQGWIYDRSTLKIGSELSWEKTPHTHRKYAVHPLCIRRWQKPPYPCTKQFENVRPHALESLAYTPPGVPVEHEQRLRVTSVRIYANICQCYSWHVLM